MFKENDDKKGLIRVYWKDVSDRVRKVDPIMARIIDDLSPDRTFPLYLAYYPYGSVIAETTNFYLPYDQGSEGFKLTDLNISKVILKDLGYAKNSLPMGIVLEKTIEYSIDLKGENVSIPYYVYEEGHFFPFNLVLGDQNKSKYSPNGLFNIISGRQSAFYCPILVRQCNMQDYREILISSQSHLKCFMSIGVFSKRLLIVQ